MKRGGASSSPLAAGAAASAANAAAGSVAPSPGQGRAGRAREEPARLGPPPAGEAAHAGPVAWVPAGGVPLTHRSTKESIEVVELSARGLAA